MSVVEIEKTYICFNNNSELHLRPILEASGYIYLSEIHKRKLQIYYGETEQSINKKQLLKFELSEGKLKVEKCNKSKLYVDDWSINQNLEKTNNFEYKDEITVANVVSIILKQKQIQVFADETTKFKCIVEKDKYLDGEYNFLGEKDYVEFENIDCAVIEKIEPSLQLFMQPIEQSKYLEYPLKIKEMSIDLKRVIDILKV